MSSRFILVCLIAVGAQIGVVSLTQGAAAAEEPAWFKKSMAREKKVRRTSKITSPGGVLTGRMPGKIATKPQKSDESWYFSSDIGTDSPFECAFFEELLDVAHVTSLISDNIVAAMVENIGPLQAKSLSAVSASHIKGSPVFSLEWIYTVGEQGSAQVGLAKVRSTTIGETTLVCFHNELGYRSTFERAFETVVSSVKGVDQEPAYYEALYIQSVNDQPVGFMRMNFTEDADGDTRSVVVDGALIAIDNQTLSTSDSSSVGYSTADGFLINALASSAENGELVMDLQLNPLEGGGWQVSGEFQGKPLEVAIDGSAELHSDLGQVLATAELQRSTDRNKATLSTWVPSVDPVSLLPVDIVLNKDDRNTGRMAVGGIDMQVKLDSQGNMINGVGEVGPVRVTVERVWESGQVPSAK